MVLGGCLPGPQMRLQRSDPAAIRHGLQRDRVPVSSVILPIWAELYTQDARRRSQAFRFSLSVEPA